MKDASGYRIEDTEWHRITAFNGLGKSVASYAKKGQLVQVTGRLHYSQWKDDKGETRYGTVGGSLTMRKSASPGG